MFINTFLKDYYHRGVFFTLYAQIGIIPLYVHGTVNYNIIKVIIQEIGEIT